MGKFEDQSYSINGLREIGLLNFANLHIAGIYLENLKCKVFLTLWRMTRTIYRILGRK